MLKLKVDTLEGVDEKHHDLYEKTGDIYVLKVEGVEDVTGLKSKRDELLGKLASSKSKLEEKEKELEELRKKAPSEDVEALKKSIDDERKALSDERERLKREINEGRVREYSIKHATEHGNGPGEIELLAEKISKFIKYEDGEFWVLGSDGSKTVKQIDSVIDDLKKSFPFLFKGTRSSGADLPGGPGKATQDWRKLSPREQIEYGRRQK